MEKITHLTPEQKAAIPAHVEKWKKIALSTDPINFELAKETVTKLYELSGLKTPVRIIKILSPIEININISVGNAVYNEIRIAIWNAARHAIIAVRNAVIDAINDKVSNAVYIATWTSVKNAGWNAIHGGSIWADDYARYSFCRDVLNIKLPEIYNISEQSALNCIFYLPFENTAYICEKPQSINIQTINNRHRLHNTSGPAIQWRDNYNNWYIEGFRVNEQIVMRPETQTINQIDRESNEEIRRIRIERYGWIKYLENSGAKLINSRINERDNQKEQLYQHRESYRESNRFICVDPSTGRKYAIAVPRKIKTCIEAQRYLSHGLDKFAIHRS